MLIEHCLHVLSKIFKAYVKGQSGFSKKRFHVLIILLCLFKDLSNTAVCFV